MLFVADKLPDGVPYEFRKLADQLREVPEAIPGEVRRILKRKRAEHGDEELDKRVIARLTSDLKDLNGANQKDGSLARLAEELIVARALAAAREQSQPSHEAAKDAAQKELRQFLQEISDDNGGGDANLGD